MYCVYLVVYKGNMLPPFYIGSTSTDKIKNGYMGSVTSKRYRSIYKRELRNHPQKFSIKILTVTSNRDEALVKERLIQEKLNVVNNPLYINQSIASVNGFFGMRNKGNLNGFYGRTHSEESLEKMRKPKYSVENYRKPKSDMHRKNISMSQKGVPWSEKDRISKTAICEHCGVSTTKTNITRWHGDRCKQLTTQKTPPMC